MTKRKQKKLLREMQRIENEESMTWKIELHDCFEFPQQITTLEESFLSKSAALKEVNQYKPDSSSFMKFYLRSNTGLCYQV